MKMNSAGQIVVKENDAIQALYQNKNISDIVVEDEKWISRYNNLVELFDFPESRINYELASELNGDDFVDHCVNEWNMPPVYATLDIKNYLIDKLHVILGTTDIVNTVEWKRVELELQEFEKRNMINVLRFLVYFIDTLTKNKIVWGVGRGSSVASYVLYLIGVHRVNSIKYNLDIKEFLK